jgi:hypothetical protein
MAETLFGSTITLSTGRAMPTRWIGAQHVREDAGFTPYAWTVNQPSSGALAAPAGIPRCSRHA